MVALVIKPEMVKDAPELPEIWADLRAECEASTFVLAHNAGFDIGVLCATLAPRVADPVAPIAAATGLDFQISVPNKMLPLSDS